MICLTTPLTKEKIRHLSAGETVELSGSIYTARDRAHKKIIEMAARGQRLALDMEDQVIYYCGPNVRNGELGSCGPTTAARMDPFTEGLLHQGVCAVIGKGSRACYMRDVFKRYQTVYFLTHAGCAAYLRERVVSFKIVAFPEMGTEAIHKFVVKDFPLIVGIDSRGNDIYENLSGRE